MMLCTTFLQWNHVTFVTGHWKVPITNRRASFCQVSFWKSSWLAAHRARNTRLKKMSYKVVFEHELRPHSERSEGQARFARTATTIRAADASQRVEKRSRREASLRPWKAFFDGPIMANDCWRKMMHYSCQKKPHKGIVKIKKFYAMHHM